MRKLAESEPKAHKNGERNTCVKNARAKAVEVEHSAKRQIGRPERR